MDRVIKTCFDDEKPLRCKDDVVAGFLKISFDDFRRILNESGYFFSIRSSSKLKGSPIITHETIKLNRQVPFLIEKRTNYVCCRGKLSYKLKMDKMKDHDYPTVRRTRNKKSKKLGCEAYFHAYEIQIFNDYFLTGSNNWRHIKKMFQKLKSDLQDSSQNVQPESKVFIHMKWTHNHPATLSSLYKRKIKTEEIEVEIVEGTTGHSGYKITELFDLSNSPRIEKSTEDEGFSPPPDVFRKRKRKDSDVVTTNCQSQQKLHPCVLYGQLVGKKTAKSFTKNMFDCPK